MAAEAGVIILENGRQFYYFRYIDRLITTPLLLLDLVLLALARPGRNVGLSAGIIALDVFMVLDVLAKVLFGFLLLSDHQTLQEVGGGGARASGVR
jgi:bacteriorhodopsin